MIPARSHALPVALLLLVAAPATAQKKQPPTPKPEWPKLSKADKATGIRALKLVRSIKPATRDKAVQSIANIGLGMAPKMFYQLNDKDRYKTNETIAGILKKLMKPEHAALLATQSKHKSVFARRFVFQRLATWARPESTPTLRKGRKDKDLEVAYYASLGLIRTAKDTKALDTVLTRCTKDWDLICDEVHRYLKPSRDAAYHPWLGKKLQDKDLVVRLAALRMMRSLATSDAKSMVKPLLDSSDSILKKESINTLRVIVDGQDPLPLKKITVFMIIKMAKEWKARI